MTMTIELSEFGSIFDEMGEQLSAMDFEPVMIASLELLADGEKQAFNAGCNPTTGERWAPNAGSTIKRKGHGVPLFDTGALEASLIAVGAPGNIHETSHNGLLFGTDVEYSLFNQEGTSRIPARPHLGTTEKMVDVIAEEVLDLAIEQLKE